MDWPRARLILIALFLLMNAFLSLQIWGPEPLGFRAPAAVAERGGERELRDRLARFGIHIAGEIPRGGQALPLLRLAVTVPPPRATVRRFFPRNLPPPDWPEPTDSPTAPPPVLPARVLRFAAGAASLTMDEAGRVRFRQEPADPAIAGALLAARRGGPLTPAAVQEAAAAVLERFGEAVGGGVAHLFTASFPEPVRSPAVGRWSPLWDGVPLFGAGRAVRFELAPDRATVSAVQLDRADVRPAGPAGEARPTIPGREALLRLALALDERGLPGGTVVRATLGYLAHPLAAASWEAPPVWEIELRDGRRFYLNAFTGEPEGDPTGEGARFAL